MTCFLVLSQPLTFKINIMRYLQLAVVSILFFFLSCKDEKATSTEPMKENIENSETFNEINRIEPPHWWTGFKDNTLQLLVHHPQIGAAEASLSYNGISITEQHQARSENYLFLDLELSKGTQPGKFTITFEFDNGEKLRQTYELKSREKSSEDYIGFNSSDAIYLITPDRFANANPNNDSVEGLLETKVFHMAITGPGVRPKSTEQMITAGMVATSKELVSTSIILRIWALRQSGHALC